MDQGSGGCFHGVVNVLHTIDKRRTCGITRKYQMVCLQEDNWIIDGITLGCTGTSPSGRNWDSQKCGMNEIFGWAEEAEAQAADMWVVSNLSSTVSAMLEYFKQTWTQLLNFWHRCGHRVVGGACWGGGCSPGNCAVKPAGIIPCAWLHELSPWVHGRPRLVGVRADNISRLCCRPQHHCVHAPLLLLLACTRCRGYDLSDTPNRILVLPINNCGWGGLGQVGCSSSGCYAWIKVRPVLSFALPGFCDYCNHGFRLCNVSLNL